MLAQTRCHPGRHWRGDLRPQPSVLTRGAGDRSPTLSSLCACTLKVYAAFTTLASFLALAVELQHGGRDLAETWPRPRRDLAETSPRPGRDLAET